MSLHAISPVDGRYLRNTESLRKYFSEYALIRERCRIELEYLISLSALKLPQMPQLTAVQIDRLRSLVSEFDTSGAERVKEIEKRTNHDVKAVEYYLKENMDAIGLSQAKEWIHFGLTSQDINNTAVPILVRDAITDVLMPLLDKLLEVLDARASEWRQIPMLGHTHGQPATPTTLGKEIAVFTERLKMQIAAYGNIMHYGKFGGATGNLNAHKAAYSDIDWPRFADRFLDSLGLIREQTTTQIDHYDHLAEICHCWMRINTILIDLSRDIWQYISMEYLTQAAVAGEVGSSTMPHKVNPIDFENAEGNLGMANALFGHLADKLPISRLQRDLTDSTVLRNVGVPFAHTLVALESLQKGLGKVAANSGKIAADLDSHWIVLSEPIQTILRREGVAEPYELLKELTRGAENVTKERLWTFIEGLDVSEDVKKELKALSPDTYTGYV